MTIESCGHYGYDEFTEQGANGMFELTTKLEQNGIEVLLMRRLENRHLLERLGTFVARIIIFAINTNFLAFLASQLLLARGTQAPPDLSNSQHTSSGQDPAPDGQRANAMPGSSYRSPGFYDNQTSNDGVSSQTSVPRNAPALTSSNQNFIVLCSNDSRWLTTREDLNVASIRSNNELFQAFRLCLRRRGNWARRMLSLQSVQRVTFVKVSIIFTETMITH
jgi:hypothetical protein